MSVHIRRARAAELIDLRHAVLRAGFPRDAAIFPGDDAASSIHFAAEDDGVIVGCVTLHLSEWNNARAWQLRGMAVASSHQRRGIGSMLLQEIDTAVSQSNVRQLWCNGRVPVVAFYESHGWKIVSDVFDIPASGPHVKLVKAISPPSI